MSVGRMAGGFLAGILAAGLGYAAAAPALALTISTPAAVTGQWDITLADTNRSCRVSLRTDTDKGSNAVNMPAGCRLSLPILANVGSFDVPRADHIALSDRAGNEILDFTEDGKLSFVANGPQGETYHLVAISGAFVQSERGTPAGASKPPGFQTVDAKLGESATMPARITAAIKQADLAGRYAVLREGNKDTGCMVTLDDKARAAKGGFRATLAPACRDQGIVIFDPMGWQLERGRLVLTARKGHSTHLDLQPDGTWAKDPKEGKGLSLKKL